MVLSFSIHLKAHFQLNEALNWGHNPQKHVLCFMFQVVFFWKGVQFPFISLYVLSFTVSVLSWSCHVPVILLSCSSHFGFMSVHVPLMFSLIALSFSYNVLFMSFHFAAISRSAVSWSEATTPETMFYVKEQAESETDLAVCNTSNQKPVISVHCNALWCAVMLCDEMCCDAVMLCDEMCCGALWWDVLWCSVMRCAMMLCDEMCCDALWWDVLWRSVMRCAVMLCDEMCCDAVMLWCSVMLWCCDAASEWYIANPCRKWNQLSRPSHFPVIVTSHCPVIFLLFSFDSLLGSFIFLSLQGPLPVEALKWSHNPQKHALCSVFGIVYQFRFMLPSFFIHAPFHFPFMFTSCFSPACVPFFSRCPWVSFHIPFIFL